MIEAQRNTPHNKLSVSAMCQIAGVSRSGYYNWLNNRDNRLQKEIRDRADFELILEAYRFRGYDKGARGIHMRLLHLNPPVVMNPKKIRRLMKKYDLVCPIRKANPNRRIAKALKTNAVADNNLKREFKEHGPRAVLLTDITYLRFQGKFCYLSVIMDAFTEQVLSYVLSQSLEVDFVLETVKNLIRDYGVTLESNVMIHSDQGCHYTSVAFRTLLGDVNLRQSMSRRGNCWDNAPQESFFGHMKDHLKPKSTYWITFEDIQRDVDDWMDYYNNDRYKWGLNKMSPNEYYNYIMSL